MDKVISAKDLLVLLKRRTGRTTNLIDIISNHLYNESNKTYGVLIRSSEFGVTLCQDIVDAASFMGVKFLVHRKTMIQSDRDVTVHFYLDSAVERIQGVLFDDVFFDDPRSFINFSLVENLLHRIRQE